MSLSAGRPYPFGAVVDDGGINFALFSAHAEKVELCLFDQTGSREIARLPLPEKTDDVWHGYLAGGRPGLLYGYRVTGPYRPKEGHRFNPNKLLIDPYARELDRSFVWNDIHCGYKVGDPKGDLSFDPRDDGPLMPKCRVAAPLAGAVAPAPETSLSRSVIYEMHLRGFTMRHPKVEPALRGTAAGLRHPAVIDHLQKLGITAVEFLPVTPAAVTRRLAEKGLRDYWGYSPIAYFAVEPRYLAGGREDFRRTVSAFHAAGIEVILDMVFNHTGENDVLGPTLSFRGIDNASYYMPKPDRRYPQDWSGCGNSLNLDHPRVLQLVMDSLRYWAGEMGVDGFRFDLAVSPGRVRGTFTPEAPFFACIAQDPVLSHLKMIAEPWDLGPDGYRLGGFPKNFSEWNDRYRDDVRRFWRSDAGLAGRFASRLAGSSDVFGARKPQAGVNFVTAHDGFTLADLVGYREKHNLANGEGGRDGRAENFSMNCGAEGETGKGAVLSLRERQRRNFVATLFLSQGVPMLLMGDEVGRSQGGNNNAYCQDNEIGWMDWQAEDRHGNFLNFVRRLAKFRRDHPVFRRKVFFSEGRIGSGGVKDILWLTPGGREMTQQDWTAPQTRCLGVRFDARLDRGAEGGAKSFLLTANAAPERVRFSFPVFSGERRWYRLIDTEEAEATPACFAVPGDYPLAPRSLALFSCE